MHRLVYRSGSGYDEIELDNRVVNVGTATGIRGREWMKTIGRTNLYGVHRCAAEKSLTVAFLDPAKADLARGVFDRDVLNETPGRLVYGGEWEQRAYVTSFSPSDLYDTGGVSGEIKVVLLDGVWRREHVVEFAPGKTEGVVGGFLDYPYDFSHDFAQPRQSMQIEANEFFPSPVIIRIPGPAESPSIVIGGNLYEVDTEVPANSTLVIDGVSKTVEIVTQYGTSTSVFQYATRGSGKGGGSYIFQQLPAGVSPVTWDGKTTVRVSWFDEEGEPPWKRS